VLLDEKMLIYPGDITTRIRKTQDIKTNGWNVSELYMSTHSGTHVDTLLHIMDDKDGVENIPLEKCIGECQVIDLTKIPFGECIKAEHLKDFSIEKNNIILIKTRNSTLDRKEFYDDFIYLSENAAEYLIKKDIKALGFDYLSIGSKMTHKILLINGVNIYENLDLKKIKPKKYIFIGLPLKIKAEGSPARVVLIENSPIELF